MFFNSFVFRSGCICVCLGPEASVHDEIRVMCQALWLSSMLSTPASRGPPTQQQQSEPLPPFIFWLTTFIEVVSLFNTRHTFFSKVTGKWCMRVTNWWTKFSIHFSKVSVHKNFLTYKSSSLSCEFLSIEKWFCSSRCGSCRMGHKTNSTGLGWMEGRVEIKKQLSCETSAAISHCLYHIF